jgi:hypothetical protein
LYISIATGIRGSIDKLPTIDDAVDHFFPALTLPEPRAALAIIENTTDVANARTAIITIRNEVARII